MMTAKVDKYWRNSFNEINIIILSTFIRNSVTFSFFHGHSRAIQFGIKLFFFLLKNRWLTRRFIGSSLEIWILEVNLNSVCTLFCFVLFFLVYIYIYIYIYIYRERERERESMCVCSLVWVLAVHAHQSSYLKKSVNAYENIFFFSFF